MSVATVSLKILSDGQHSSRRIAPSSRSRSTENWDEASAVGADGAEDEEVEEEVEVEDDNDDGDEEEGGTTGEDDAIAVSAPTTRSRNGPAANCVKDSGQASDAVRWACMTSAIAEATVNESSLEMRRLLQWNLNLTTSIINISTGEHRYE